MVRDVLIVVPILIHILPAIYMPALMARNSQDAIKSDL